MATENKRTGTNSTPNTFPTTPTEAIAGQPITASNLRNMISLVEALINHNHKWTDTYSSNCQCACSRGVL